MSLGLVQEKWLGPPGAAHRDFYVYIELVHELQEQRAVSSPVEYEKARLAGDLTGRPGSPCSKARLL